MITSMNVTDEVRSKIRAYTNPIEAAIAGVTRAKDGLLSAEDAVRWEDVGSLLPDGFEADEYADALSTAVTRLNKALLHLGMTGVGLASAFGARFVLLDLPDRGEHGAEAPTDLRAALDGATKDAEGARSALRTIVRYAHDVIGGDVPEEHKTVSEPVGVSWSALCHVLRLVVLADAEIEEALAFVAVPPDAADGEFEPELTPKSGHGGEESSESVSSAESADGTHENATVQQPQVPVAVQQTLQAMRDEDDDEKRWHQKSSRQLADVSSITDWNCGEGLEGPQ